MASAKKNPQKGGKKSVKKAGKPAAKKPAAKKPAAKKPSKPAAKKPAAKKTVAKKPAKPAKPAGPASKGRPFPKKSAPAVNAGSASVAAAGKPDKPDKAVKAEGKAAPAAASSSGTTAATNDGFQRRLLLPPPPKVERKSKHALKPLRDIPTPLVVDGSENPWSKDELKEMKARLTKDLAKYKEELASAEAQAAELLQDSSDGAGDDQADAGTKTFEREHELSLVYNAQDLVLQTELALARIAAGTYTKCELCGNPIGKARLQVFPRATLCMLCKQKEERR